MESQTQIESRVDVGESSSPRVDQDRTDDNSQLIVRPSATVEAGNQQAPPPSIIGEFLIIMFSNFSFTPRK